MVDITALRRNYRESQKESRTQRDSTIARLEREIAETKETSTQELDYQKAQHKEGIINYVIGNLIADFNFLNNVSTLSEYSPQEIGEANKISEALSNLSQDSDKERKTILNNAPEKVREILIHQEDEQENYGGKDITSYLGWDGSSCYLIPPISSTKPEKGLVRMLQDKILGILALDKIILDQKVRINGERQVLNVGTEKIIFKTEPDETKFGFTLYAMTPKNGEGSLQLMQILKEKIESKELEIESFKKYGINHKIKFLSDTELEYVRGAEGIYFHSETETPDEQIEQIEVQPPMQPNNSYSKKPIASTKRRLEALSRLKAYSREDLAISEIQEILGYQKYADALRLIQDGALSSTKNKRGPRVISKEDFNKFIRTAPINPFGFFMSKK